MSGFRERQFATARDRIKTGDILLCYLVRLSRWCGALEVKSPLPARDSTPIFSDPDPFIVRFKVNPLVLLNLDRSPPMLGGAVWDNLEETKRHYNGVAGMGNKFPWVLAFDLTCGRCISACDCSENIHDAQTVYPLTERDQRHLAVKRKVQTLTGQVEVEVPEKGDDQDELGENSADSLEPVVATDFTGKDEAGARVAAKHANPTAYRRS